MFPFISAANLQAAQVVDETFHRFSAYTQTMHPPQFFLFLHLSCTCTRECVRGCASVSHRVGIKAWDDPFFVEQTLHFDRSLPRHYCSLGASALLIQHPRSHMHTHKHRHLNRPPLSPFSSHQIYGLETRTALTAAQWAFCFWLDLTNCALTSNFSGFHSEHSFPSGIIARWPHTHFTDGQSN